MAATKLRFGKTHGSCLCFCKASLLKGNPGLGWLAGWLVGWLFGWLACGWLLGWLLAWLLAGFWLALALAGFWLGLAGLDLFFSLFFSSPCRNAAAGLGVVLLQPHACAQHFRFRILRRTRSFPGRTSVRSLPGAIESVWEIPFKERERASLNVGKESRHQMENEAPKAAYK